MDAIAGCSTAEQATLVEIALINNSPNRQEVHVQLTRDETTLFEQVTAIEGGEPDAKTETTTLRFDSLQVGNEYELEVGLNGSVVSTTPVRIDCTPDDGGEQFGVRITSSEAVTVHDSNC